MGQVLLKLRQDAHTARSCGNELQLFCGVDGGGALAGWNIEGAQNNCRRAAKQAHRRTSDRHEYQHWWRHGHSQRLGPAQRQPFGHQLACNNVKISDDGETKSHGDHVAVDPCAGECAQPPRHHLRCQRLAQPAKRKRAKSHAKLHGGKQVIEITLQIANRSCSRHPRGQQLLHACVANGDQCKLNCDKVSVGQNQHGHRDRLDEQKLVHLAVRIALDGARSVSIDLVRGVSWEPDSCRVRSEIGAAI